MYMFGLCVMIIGEAVLTRDSLQGMKTITAPVEPQGDTIN